MKEKDVRIGNLVIGTYENENGEIKRNICRIMAVDETSSLGEGWNFLLERVQGEPTEYYDDTEPIPLSEEWIIKAKNEDYKFFKQTDGSYSLVEDLGDGITWFVGRLEYVHQMQNLYFALTGKELEFKL